ncbi:MAG: DUF2007 domain-containing protein [Candidatus Azobacteroides sp.]|nr:DUF2007 domain-containing protein [Candidatus Azobacteroides sp.]
MNSLVEVARFMYPSEADVLVSLLQEENIEYVLDSSNIIPGADIRLMVNSNKVSKAIEIIKEGGFKKFLSNDI